MRFHLAAVLLLIVLLPVGPLLAQEQPPATAPAQPPAPKPETRKGASGSIKPAGKTCAIPLLNVLKDKAAAPDRMPRAKPAGPPGEKFSSMDIIVPAPSCDDVK